MLNRPRTCAALLAAALPIAPLSAATIAVVPIRIDLDPKARFCALHVSNFGQDEVSVQMRGFAWSQQPNGSDRLDPVDVRVNPAIMTLAAGERRLVRCSLPESSSASESTFRLLIDEIPRSGPTLGTMRTILRLSVPIFRTPAAAKPVLHWRPAGPDALEFSNSGEMHAVIGGVILIRGGAAPLAIRRGFYLLRGSRRTVPISGDSAAVTRVDIVTANGARATIARADN